MADNVTQPMIHRLDPQSRPVLAKTIIYPVAIIVFGILTGYVLSRMSFKSSQNPEQSVTGKTQSVQVVGSTDNKTFSDSAEGQLEANGVDGEGTHKLIRKGGESQTVYLTSSVLDLSQFVGKSVRVWGQTFAAKKAGWLMDVGKVEVLQ